MPSSKHFDTQLAIRSIWIMAVLFAGQAIAAPVPLPGAIDSVDDSPSGGCEDEAVVERSSEEPFSKDSPALIPRNGPHHSCTTNSPNGGCKDEAILERSSSIIPRNKPGHSCVTNSPNGGCEDEAVLARSVDAEPLVEESAAIVARAAPGNSCLYNQIRLHRSGFRLSSKSGRVRTKASQKVQSMALSPYKKHGEAMFPASSLFQLFDHDALPHTATHCRAELLPKMSRRTTHHAPIRATIRAHTPAYGPPPPEPLNDQGERAFFSPEHNAWLDNLYGWPAGSALGIYQANAALREDARRLIDAANMRSPPQYDAVVTPTHAGDGSSELDGNDPSPPPNYTRFEVAERRVNSAPRNRENLPFYRPDAPRGTRMYHPMCEGAVVSNGPGVAPRCQPLRELPGEIRYRRNARSNGTQIPDDVPTGWRLPTGWRAHAAAVNLEIERERERRSGVGVNWLEQLGNPVYNPGNPVYNPDQLGNPVYNPEDQAFLREEQTRWEARQARRQEIVAQEMARHGIAELPQEDGAEPTSGTPITASMADVLRRQARHLEYYDPVTHLPRVSEYERLTGIAPFGRGNVQPSQNNIFGNPPPATPQSAFAGASNQGTPRGGLFGRSPSVGQSGRRVTFAENIAEEPQTIAQSSCDGDGDFESLCFGSRGGPFVFEEGEVLVVGRVVGVVGAEVVRIG
ncbi:uncharacterized protein MYCGRDRAFT_97237 [Zymoseptoria tritici IPO323]|uniref:Uncharacterized protein n=1 Tax=Zymoseptoria tritici (strain CBS 115943 / IPO323) TaxID=336722 RepID=F9XPB4_ZYMTI|nr:uncharacterized protein MYCGRDRAFT_97237 [Zymoseptoria tritici IPO323]EGP83022.1 hypothetical protein MYCGRDRAFT_97237 [Zymoseptoria tritici IPO323]